MGLRLATLKAVSLLHNVSTLNQCRKLFCGTVVCNHLASYRPRVPKLQMGFNSVRWGLTSFSKLFVLHTNDLVCRLILCAVCTRRTVCTVTTDLLERYSNTQNDFFPGAAIFSLASPSGRNVNYDEKQLCGEKEYLSSSFYVYRFPKYVSNGFPIINLCNPGVYYKTPCRFHTLAQFFEALRYKPERRGIDSRWCHWNFPLT
jgi:hypothetical protein